MKWFPRLRSRKSNDDNSTLELFRQIYGWGRTVAGVEVTLQVALRTATFLACSRVIAEGCAQVPCELIRLSADRKSRTPAFDDPRYRLLYRKPNADQTSFEFRETLVMHACVTGNGYAFPLRIGDRLVELVTLEPNRVGVWRDTDGTIYYDILGTDGRTMRVTRENIFHLRGPSWNSYVGMDMVSLASSAIGLASALETGQSALQSKGMQMSGVYSVDGTLDDKQYKQIQKWLKEHHEGPEKVGAPMILDRNAKWLPMVMNAVEAEVLNSRRLQVEEICRAMRVMPIMVGFTDKTATYASAEQMFLAHVVHTLSPWYERIEQAMDTQLLSDKDLDAGLCVDLDEQNLLRGALKDTTDALVKLSGGGILTRNEARRRINYNPLEGLDEPLVPTTSPPASELEDPPADPPQANP